MTDETARDVLVAALADRTGGLGNFTLRGDSLATAEVARFDLESRMGKKVMEDIWRAGNRLSDKQFLGYDPSYQTSSSQVLVEDLDSVPELAAVDGVVRSGDVAIDSGGDSAVAMVHSLGAGDNMVVAYRLKGPGVATRRQGIPLLPNDGVYRVVSGDLLYYEANFDVFTCGGFAFFETVSLIQNKLQAPEKAQELARKTLATVTAKVKIVGLAELEKAVLKDPTLRAKMASVARLIEADPDYADALTTDSLVDFVKKYPDYDILLSDTADGPALLFNASPQHRHQIPRLLADDYLHSFLTDRSYEAGSKHRVSS